MTQCVSSCVRPLCFAFLSDAIICAAAGCESVWPLKALHPEYRIEYDSQPDPQWSPYIDWLKSAPNS